jgi:hypothetical protein
MIIKYIQFYISIFSLLEDMYFFYKRNFLKLDPQILYLLISCNHKRERAKDRNKFMKDLKKKNISVKLSYFRFGK